jgi:transposase
MHLYFVGLDVHKQTIAFCVKTAEGRIVREASVASRRTALDEWVKTLPVPCVAGMETTIFSHWIYQHLAQLGVDVRMGHAFRMKAICAGKNKSDKLDARTIADLLRADLFPACYVIDPELGALRRQMRFRRRMVEEEVRFRNKTAGLLMECGIEYDGRRLHGKRYFAGVLQQLGEREGDQELRPLLEFNRRQIDTLRQMSKQVIRMLSRRPQLAARVEALRKIDGVGPVTALTWALEIADPRRFGSMRQAQSYCGLTSALRESAGKQQRAPISKQRNAHLQSALIEAAKLAPMYNPALKAVHTKARERGENANTATLEVARKLVRYLLAADRAFVAGQTGPVAA